MKAKLFCLLLLALCLLCACGAPDPAVSSEPAPETTRQSITPGPGGPNQFSQGGDDLPEQSVSSAELYADAQLSVRLMYGLSPADFGPTLLLRFENRSGQDLSVGLRDVLLNGNILAADLSADAAAGKTTTVSGADWLQALRICEEDRPTQFQCTVTISDGTSERQESCGVRLTGDDPKLLADPIGGACFPVQTLCDDENCRLELLCLGADPTDSDTVCGVIQARNKTEQALPLRIVGLSLNGQPIRDSLGEIEVPAQGLTLLPFRFPASDLQAQGIDRVETAALTVAAAGDAEFSLSITEDAP